MDPLLEEELKVRRIKSMAICRQYMAEVNGETKPEKGRIAGRTVTRINHTEPSIIAHHNLATSILK